MNEKNKISQRDTIYYILWLFICCSYSILQMYIDTKGDFSIIHSPFAGFFQGLIAVTVSSGLIAGLLKIFIKSPLSKILMWTSIFVVFFNLFGQSRL